MDLDQASKIIDQLNAVFSGEGEQIPSAEQLYDAISVFEQKIEISGTQKHALLENIKSDEMIVDKETAKVASDLRDYALRVVEIIKLKESLEKTLGTKAPESRRRLRI